VTTRDLVPQSRVASRSPCQGSAMNVWGALDSAPGSPELEVSLDKAAPLQGIRGALRRFPPCPSYPQRRDLPSSPKMFPPL
jgi:hypothetical protein